MAKYTIEGGQKLSGSVTPSGNKNEALPALAACLLTDQPVTLTNFPPIVDALTLISMLEDLGVEAKWLDKTTLKIHAKKIASSKPDPRLCAAARGSILFLGPLLARMGSVELTLPGGDVIGARRIDTHWEGLVGLGAVLELDRGKIRGKLPKLSGAELFLDEPSVTATENILMLAAACPETTVIHNAACEPHVVGLCKLLVAMGAQISGIGSNRIEVRGSKTLKGCEHRISPDFMEVGSFVCLAAIAANEQIAIQGVVEEDYRFIRKVWNRLGIKINFENNALLIEPKQILKIRSDISGRVPTIYSGPWPAFPTDLMSVAITAATQSDGTVLFFEKMFEGRMFFIDHLLSMGATIILCDPHRIVVTGKSKLYGARMSSPDVRAGMALIIAALVADGASEIGNILQVERGYFDLVSKLRGLGAKIERVETH